MKRYALLALGASAALVLYLLPQLQSNGDADAAWLRKSESRGAYEIVVPANLSGRVLGGPFERSFQRWSPEDIRRKLTIAPLDGIAEVTSPGFDAATNEVLIFYDSDSLKKYGSRPYYAIIAYGGESIELKEVEAKYAKEIARTGVYIARIPTGYDDIRHLRIHKVYAQVQPPEKTYEVDWYSKVEVKYQPDCDC